jgi:hypothetical protein
MTAFNLLNRCFIATEENQVMKHLLTGVAVIAALAFSAPVGAQPANPSGGNALGLPGANPGGPGLTPYSSSPARPTAVPSPSAPASAGQMPPPSMSDATSATPPKHHHAHAGSHGKMASHHPSRFPNLQGDSVANQLNQTELARLQSGDFTPPPATPTSEMGPPARTRSGANRMPAGGRATSTRYGN